MYVLAALALIFYVSKVPERYFPGEASKSLESGKTLFVLLFAGAFCCTGAGAMSVRVHVFS